MKVVLSITEGVLTSIHSDTDIEAVLYDFDGEDYILDHAKWDKKWEDEIVGLKNIDYEMRIP